MTDLKHEAAAEQWAALIRERMDSGMTIKEWCRQRNIKKSQYYYWLKTLRRSGVIAAGQDKGAAPFVELTAICQEPEAVYGRTGAVIRKGSVSIEITEYASADFITKILEAAANVW